MEYEHEAHRETYEKVEKYLARLFEERFRDPDDGHFYVTYGSTVLEIAVDPYGPEEAIVRLMAYCVQGVSVDENLERGLLETNLDLPIGAFALVDRDVFLCYSVLGKNTDYRTLLDAIAAVANTSDEYDDLIVAKFGGETAIERLRREGEAASSKDSAG
jgi:hypothetical protein